MTIMIIGLLIFLGSHSVRIFAEDWRQRQIVKHGENTWKIAYSVVSVIGLAIAIYGFGQMRLDPIYVWFPPMGLRHAVALLMVPAFIMLVAAYVPRNAIKAKLGHPMMLAVKIWAFSHLLANGRLGDIIFFAAFLVWAILAFKAAKKRDRLQPVNPVPTSAPATIATVVIGLIAYVLFALYLHTLVIGVPVFS
ncbi:NnrU family protein [Halomonas sp. XH26]|uniref:NnrU family protein n=1 Tax=Vreelandella alkaliphila TaxID=272774 RepID=A0AAJ2RUY0_9GAMM|nr:MULTISPECIES: NnrU family protein [Halomonas]AYF34368.1 NnrU family protein [Halomonas alkaliphila]MCD6438151.1 NnrU family protein [Halomonas sp.]MDX5976924.1 NnrU family protein [Halomonas alkaliphila]PAU71409.1 NnrU family protein [Halomonas humidisoli]UTA78862.1 NnrU family protein [Halomonas sp. XH26]